MDKPSHWQQAAQCLTTLTITLTLTLTLQTTAHAFELRTA